MNESANGITESSAVEKSLDHVESPWLRQRLKKDLLAALCLFVFNTREAEARWGRAPKKQADAPSNNQHYEQRMKELQEVLGEKLIPSSTAAPHATAAALDVGLACIKLTGENVDRWNLPREGAQLQSILKELTFEYPHLEGAIFGLANLGSRGCAAVNELFKQHGLGHIQLNDDGRADTLYAGSLVDIEGQWQVAGEKADITLLDKNGKPLFSGEKEKLGHVDGARFTQGLKIQKTAEGNHIFELATDKEDTKVCCMPLPNNATNLHDEYARLNYINTVRGSAQELDYHKVGSVTIPCVDHTYTRTPMNEIQGATCGSRTINQSNFGAVIKMDENGFQAKAGAQFAATRGGVPGPEAEHFVISGPFIMWIEKGGIPAIHSLISYDSMKRPVIENKHDGKKR